MCVRNEAVTRVITRRKDPCAWRLRMWWARRSSLTCRRMRGSLPTVLDQTKLPAPGWRRNFDKQDGPKPGPLSAAGMDGKMRSYRWNRNRRFKRIKNADSRMIGVNQTIVRVICVLLFVNLTAPGATAQTRPRARELGVTVGILPTGPLNAITDVDGVLVGHTTLVRGDNVRTGVTAILPHAGN